MRGRGQEEGEVEIKSTFELSFFLIFISQTLGQIDMTYDLGIMNVLHNCLAC